MNRYFTNTYSITNLYKKASSNSEIVTQMIYGDSFHVLKKNNKWIKIKIKEDNYVGFIKKKNYKDYINPTHKINKIKAKVYKFPNKRKKIDEITFGSKIRVINAQSKFLKFDKGWIDQNETKPLFFKEKNIFRLINIFKGIKYKWGGKSFKGIDCSALIQIFFNFNNKYCPRDAKDQVKYFKKNIKLRDVRKNDIIFWRGHVAVALSKNKLIHAYGPVKSTVIMGIDKTIKRIQKTTNLKVIGIKRV